MGLLLIILSFIFMKGNSVKDSESSLKPHRTPLYTPLTDTPFSRCFVGVPASAPCVPRVGYGGERQGMGGDGAAQCHPSLTPILRRQHQVFGDVRKLVTEEFVRQK